MVSANFAGDFEPQGAMVVVASKGTSAGITKGQVCSLSSNKWVTAATSATGPFAVALETRATADTTIRVLLRGIVYLTADGTINPNASLVVSAATAGDVQATATPFASGVLGKYLAKENEGDGVTEATAAADGDVIRCDFGGPF